MKELEYPFDVNYLISNKRKIKKQLLTKENLIEKNIAILGGSTTSEIKNMLEIFLLTSRVNHGLYPWYRKAYSVEQSNKK